MAWESHGVGKKLSADRAVGAFADALYGSWGYAGFYEDGFDVILFDKFNDLYHVGQTRFALS